MKLLPFLLILLADFGFVFGISSFNNVSIQFSLDFFRTAYKLNPTQNCVLSPIAIQQMLAMLHHAANRKESSQIHGLLGLPEQLASHEPLLTDLNNHALEMITKLYHSQAELNPNLLPVLEAEYSVDVQVTDFSRPKLVADSVNRWASRFTNGMVADVFNEKGFVSDDVNLMIINTLTLNASWQHQFKPANKMKGDFNFLNGVRKVDMMRSFKDFRYCQIKEIRVVELAFERSTDLSMLILKSDSQPLQRVIEKLDLETYQKIDQQLQHDKSELIMPKFTISMGIGAKRVLNAMGLNDVFGRNAFDVFVGFSSRLANVYQALRIDIDENGSRAAAGTYWEKSMRVGGSFKYVIDGPFMFVIRKDSTKDIVFIGHYSSYTK